MPANPASSHLATPHGPLCALGVGYLQQKLAGTGVRLSRCMQCLIEQKCYKFKGRAEPHCTALAPRSASPRGPADPHVPLPASTPSRAAPAAAAGARVSGKRRDRLLGPEEGRAGGRCLAMRKGGRWPQSLVWLPAEGRPAAFSPSPPGLSSFYGGSC